MHRRRGQSLLEYAILLFAIAAAFVTIFGYARSTFMGGLKSGSDGVGHGMRYRGWR